MSVWPFHAGTPGRRGTRLLRAGAALLGALALLAVADVPRAAHPAGTSLPVLRLDYEANHDSLDPKLFGLPDSLAISLDPPHATNYGDADTVALTNAGLVHVLPNDRIAPDLASHWTVSKNGLVYTFTLRKNARFSNGHPVTAADAAFSIRRTLAPYPGRQGPEDLGLIRGAAEYAAGKARTLTGVRALSARVLQITITQPAAYFLAILSLPEADILDPAAVRGKSLGTQRLHFHDGYLTQTCSGNQGAGPFKFACRNGSSTPSSFYPPGHVPTYTLVPNPYYYGPRPRIRLELPALNPTYRLYLEGRLDVTGLASAYLGQWKGKSSQYHQYPSSDVVYLHPNVHLAPFDNVHCRLAVAYALDRSTIAGKILGGTQRPTYAVVPKGMLGYYDGKDNPHYSPSRARAELARCPSRAVPVEVVAPQGFYENTPAAVVDMLTRVGMNARLKTESELDWLGIIGQPLEKTNTQIVFTDWAQDYPDPYNYFFYVLPPGRGQDIGGWHNAMYERLVDRAAVTVSEKTRAALYIKAQHVALGQGALIPLTEPVDQFLVKPYVHGLVSGPPTPNLVARDGNWANVSIGKR